MHALRHKYANAVTEHGIIEALRRFLPRRVWWPRSERWHVGGDEGCRGNRQVAYHAEMKMFEDLKTPFIFLQNIGDGSDPRDWR